MASADPSPPFMQPTGGQPPGQPMSVGQAMLDKGASVLQSLKPIKQFNQHVCTFALYGHDMSRQIETHHYVARLNQDFLQCAVYDSDDSSGRLIVELLGGVHSLGQDLGASAASLWHSHAYEIKAGLWINPRVPEMVGKPELENLAKTSGKFWCAWQVDRGDWLPLGAPALMMSPQAVNLGLVQPDLVQRRDDKYNISSEAMRRSRLDMEEPEWINPRADYWKQHGKGFAVDVFPAEMKRHAPFP